ncbi:MAG: thiamine phosphate synthase [Clostridiales bacterium]|nr:thiamine phosphate synthase [Clostridiales bacterium]
MKLDKKTMRLYAITDRHWLNGESLIKQVEDVLKAGATFLQLREKDFTHTEMVNEAKEIKKITDKYNVPFVINDDILAAKEIDADGVHIGQSDMEYSKAREILGPDKIIGISAGNVQEAITAEKMGADYIGVGAVFHTSTKKDAKDMSRETLLAIANSVNIPIVAIGGITYDNMDYLKDTGVHGVAVISAIFGSGNPGKATEKLFSKTKEVFGYE